VVINAHGLEGRFGVRFAGPSDWGGDGADLGNADLLVLLACSVGRLRQDGSRDVEGLYAELAAHHGRTVIAAPWTIADNETASLGHAIVREYLCRGGQIEWQRRPPATLRPCPRTQPRPPRRRVRRRSQHATGRSV
jgi:hypothetical protein